VIASLLGALLLLVAFAAVERASDHAMLDLSLFRSRQLVVAMLAMALVMFALFGALFLITQYLQFCLGYPPFATGVRVAPIAATLLVVAPLSSLLVRLLSRRVVVGAGFATVAAGLAGLSRVSVAGTYRDALPSLVALGVGAALALAPTKDAIMGSLPAERRGVGSGTNGAAIQTGGALGVAVLGTLLNLRYQAHLSPLLAAAPVHVPAFVRHLMLGSLGGALQVASRAPRPLGAALARVARQGFVSGMDLAMLTAAAVAAGAAVVALVALPGERRQASGPSTTDGIHRAATPQASAAPAE